MTKPVAQTWSTIASLPVHADWSHERFHACWFAFAATPTWLARFGVNLRVQWQDHVQSETSWLCHSPELVITAFLSNDSEWDELHTVVQVLPLTYRQAQQIVEGGPDVIRAQYKDVLVKILDRVVNPEPIDAEDTAAVVS